MHDDRKHAGWSEQDELSFIDYLGGTDLRFAQQGQSLKRQLTKKEKVDRLEFYICSIKRRTWPKFINPSRMENHALRVLQKVL